MFVILASAISGFQKSVPQLLCITNLTVNVIKFLNQSDLVEERMPQTSSSSLKFFLWKPRTEGMK